MALQLKKRNFKLSSATTGALLIGAGLILIKTFPHIKSTIESAVFGQKNVDVEEDENKPVEVNDTINSESETSHPALNESAVEIGKWSDESLKSYLFEKEISLPPNATNAHLVSLVKSIQGHS